MSGSMNAERAVENIKRNEDAIREEWIKAVELRLVRDELQKCHRAEGENHYLVCQPIVKVYTDMLKDAKIRGYRTVDA
ncbi:hypothetical protein MSPP1_000217 [Malassezia sp. CBS 17886]|nr:hypothetical protein MSPP1_000217 [Malassezia sp. CBS 17886]